MTIQPQIHTEIVHGAKNHGKYLGDLVYGANDGIITTFAVVSGAAGAAFGTHIVVILGMANLIADGISMGLSNYLAIKSKSDFDKRQRKVEEYEVEVFPEKEKDEIREIFQSWGFEGDLLSGAVEKISQNKKVWIDFMMKEELGIIEEDHDDAGKHGFATAISFMVAGFLPLIPYLFGFLLKDQFLVSVILTALILFIVGSLRSTVTKKSWWISGLEMLFVGGLAATSAFVVGALTKTIFGVAI